MPLTVSEAQAKSKDIRSKKCRYCTNDKDSKRFYKSYDFLDTDGKMSICIDCCTFLFNHFYSIHSRIDIAIYELCKVVNVRYDSTAYSMLMQALERNSIQSTVNAINGIEEEGGDGTFDEIVVSTKTSLFGKYLTILSRTYSNKDEDMYFNLYTNDRPEGYEDRSTNKPVSEVISEAYETRVSHLEKKWGKGYDDDDLAFLENEYNGWAKTKDTEEKAIDLLVREVCLQQLFIRRRRDGGQSVTKADMDTLTMLMDKCSLSPDKVKESNTQKSATAWGVFIKDVETMSPAEWVENQKLFKDVEGIEEYVDKHFGRALRNYVGQSRDFRVVATKLDEEATGADFSDIMDVDFEEVDDEAVENNGEE